MATMIDGESYLGKVLVRPLSESGDVTMYLWPVRCLKSKMGGPTFGVDVNGEEVIRYDPHGPRGHWHKGGYDKLGAGGSHTEFPDDVRDIQGQIAWALDQIKNTGADLLVEAGFAAAIGRRRRGIDEIRLVFRAPVPKPARQAHVHIHDQIHIGLDGR